MTYYVSVSNRQTSKSVVGSWLFSGGVLQDADSETELRVHKVYWKQHLLQLKREEAGFSKERYRLRGRSDKSWPSQQSALELFAS